MFVELGIILPSRRPFEDIPESTRLLRRETKCDFFDAICMSSEEGEGRRSEREREIDRLKID